MSAKATAQCQRKQAGLTLVELILFMVIVSVGIVGVLASTNLVTSRSVDPMLRKQALSIAASLLEEIEIQPFTFCDPDDPQAETATSAIVGVSGCSLTATVQGLGANAGETRYNDPLFDNVGDYHGFSMTGIRDLSNSPIAGLQEFTATVTMANAGATFGVANADVLRIDVQVTGPNGTDITLRSYRFRYAPRSI
jgi:MSHA pilin protein MshD